jgi:hypothetical protein
MRTDGEPAMTKLTVPFRNSANEPKKTLSFYFFLICPLHPFWFVNLTTCDDICELWQHSRNSHQPPVSSSPLDPNTLISTLFSKHPQYAGAWSTARDTVPRCIIASQTIVLGVLIISIVDKISSYGVYDDRRAKQTYALRNATSFANRSSQYDRNCPISGLYSAIMKQLQLLIPEVKSQHITQISKLVGHVIIKVLWAAPPCSLLHTHQRFA